MNNEINKNNVEILYGYILRDDESLQGPQWERLSPCDMDGPEDIMNQFIDIFINTDFVEWIDYEHPEELIANKDERRLALAKYFRILADELDGGENNE
nr:MAG TPA: hypothetical protein [Caudoviricetes sp.]